MKQHGRGCKKPHLIDPEFFEALDGDEGRSTSSHRQTERKTQQFCRQVQRALNVALADGAGVGDLFVEEVSPAPDCGRLLVHVLMPEGAKVAEVMSTLSRETARLRTEVAAAITRKRAPELFFVPVCGEGGNDE